jgi:hypothetical protein
MYASEPPKMFHVLRVIWLDMAETITRHGSGVCLRCATTFFVAKNFRILHPITKDAEAVSFGILLLCQERSIIILNYNASTQ